MKSRLRAAALAAGLSMLAGSAAADAESDALKRASERGAQIYAIDHAAWIATDEMMRRIPDIGSRGRDGGWVVEADGPLLRVVFYLADSGAPKTVFTADVREGAIVATHVVAPGEDPTLSAVDLRMIAARNVAMAAGKIPCQGGHFNPVVLPPRSADAPVVVYLLTPMVKTGEYPAGGHYEVDVGADGRIAFSRAFTRSCLTLGTGGDAQGAKPVGLAVSHLLDPTPTEIHVYLSLWAHIPVYVGTQSPTRVWAVEGARIRAVRRP